VPEDVCFGGIFGHIGLVVETPTLADKMGLPSRPSPLLQKAKRLGLHSAVLLESLGVARGCWHYRSPGLAVPPEISEADFSNEELAIALLSPGLPYSPHTIRVGAAMLGATGNDPETLARLAVAEQAVGPVHYIATAAGRFEPGNPFWRQVLELLPMSPPLPDGLMPHPTRFVSMTGMTRAGVKNVTVWLRPCRDLALPHG
jgi:hypothetical protein